MKSLLLNPVLIFCFCFFLFPEAICAQDKVKWTGSPKGSQILDAYANINRLNESFSGFRIQIHTGTDREKARDMKSRFLSLNPGAAAYESYQSPNFRIRIGDFRSRLEALSALRSVQVQFPAAFVVEDDILFPVIEP
ncbi:MAG: hypothetical protein RLZZ46_1534 [Bacteroidota bacterium]|jgi:hypothetical protein